MILNKNETIGTTKSGLFRNIHELKENKIKEIIKRHLFPENLLFVSYSININIL